MRKLALTLLFGIFGVGVYGQTIKSLGYNTTNGQIVYTGTNALTFTNEVLSFSFGAGLVISNSTIEGNGRSIAFEDGAVGGVFNFQNAVEFSAAAETRTNLGLGWSALTNMNAANFRSAIELGVDNSVEFNQVVVTKNDLTTGLYSEGGIVIEADGTNYSSVFLFSGDESVNLQARARTNLGLGASWLTNNNVTNFRSDIGLGSNNNVMFNSLSVSSGSVSSPSISIGATNAGLFYATGPNRIFVSVDGSSGTFFTTNTLAVPNITGDLSGGVAIGSGKALSFNGGANIALSRTNLGLGWSGLTNTNALNFRKDLELSSTNNVIFASLTAFNANSGVQAGVNTNSSFYIEDDTVNTTQVVFSFQGDGATRLQANARTNLGLGGGITTNRTFVSYNGTNYVTNSVTISNGIITGWTP